jgi:GNAT superfamily N-acetyltransferase
MDAALVTRPVGPAELADLGRLFGQRRTTRRCWCTAFCTTRTRFALGWVHGGNQRRFAALAQASPAPMGVLASVSDEPVGWAACGPRARYTTAIDGRSALLRTRPRDEDDRVWLLPCLLVREEFRGQGVSAALVDAATALATVHGAAAVEGWPLAASAHRPGEAFVGREEVFAGLGFLAVDRPLPGRVIMRRELTTGRSGARG